MYDVIYIDGHGIETSLAHDVHERDDACAIARREAAERGVGRAMLPGSTHLRECVCVVPTRPLPSAA
jgi:hypothetical protein